MAEINVIPGVERRDLGVPATPRAVLEAAIEGGIQDVVVIGRYPSGALYLASSDGNIDAVVGKLFAAAQRLATRRIVETIVRL